MTSPAEELKDFLETQAPVALVEVAEAKGSTPRESGARMLVSHKRIHGTIGGGQLEFMAIHRARELLRDGEAQAELDIPLGPEIGQCCGGRVALAIRVVGEALKADLIAQARQEDATLPHVYVFGGGHVGTALATAFSLLPLHVQVVETRADALEGMPAAVDRKLTPVPEEVVRDAPAGSAFVVLTHDHALDFLIVGEALKRGDAAYVGMIGSKTKKATFRSWYLKTAGGTEAEFTRLITPIGGEAVRDKRPAVIAALAAAEIMTALAARTAAAA
ncbi:MAG: xanthine dehydrogenase accessory protein XdhC [Pseudaminobacter sp.]